MHFKSRDPTEADCLLIGSISIPTSQTLKLIQRKRAKFKALPEGPAKVMAVLDELIRYNVEVSESAMKLAEQVYVCDGRNKLPMVLPWEVAVALMKSFPIWCSTNISRIIVIWPDGIGLDQQGAMNQHQLHKPFVLDHAA
jgi:hypothetical protein